MQPLDTLLQLHVSFTLAVHLQLEEVVLGTLTGRRACSEALSDYYDEDTPVSESQFCAGDWHETAKSFHDHAEAFYMVSYFDMLPVPLWLEWKI